MEYGDILYEKGEGIVAVTINGPQVLNAFLRCVQGPYL